MNDRAQHIAFADLRRAAIEYAQDASGDIWTDFNLHDPGVTLLEQTCFALSQIAYQADFDVRDLLTDREDRFAVGSEHALYDPRKVLRGAPVTRHDLNAYLSDLDNVARAWVEPDGRPGLYDITVVPSNDEIDPKALARAVSQSFARNRPLCTSIAQVTIAKRLRVILRGAVEISSAALPERIAAELYYAVSVILRGLPYTRDINTGATRSDVYDDPTALLHKPGTKRARSPDLNVHLNVLREIPGIYNVSELTLAPLDPPDPDAPNFYAAVLPVHDDQVELDFALDGTAITLDASAIREEYMRIAAERISTTHHHIKASDWDVRNPGTRREFDASHVDALLPRLYPAHGYRSAQRKDAPSGSTEMAEYRGTLDAHLGELSRDLADLPQTMASRTDPALDDQVQFRERIALLDYRIALQGETLPATQHTGLHHYRSARQRHAFELAWRHRILHALSELNATRGVGPGAQAVGNFTGGFLVKLGLFTDLNIGQTGLCEVLVDYELDLDPRAKMPPPEPYDTKMILPSNPFDMLVPRKHGAELLTSDELRALSPWLDSKSLTPAFFEATADAPRFVLAPDTAFNWHVMFDAHPDAAPISLACLDSKDAAIDTVHRLRRTWRHIHEVSEGAYLVEDVEFAASDLPYEANVATLLATGWTARTRLDAYRNFVADQVAKLAPAHVHIRICWLDHADMVRFEALRSADPTPKPRASLRKFVDEQVARR